MADAFDAQFHTQFHVLNWMAHFARMNGDRDGLRERVFY